MKIHQAFKGIHQRMQSRCFLVVFRCRIAGLHPADPTIPLHAQLQDQRNDDLLLLSVHFTFSISYVVLPFHCLCFPIFHLFLLLIFLKTIKHCRKAFVYIYTNSMYNISFRKLVNFCLTEKKYDILIPLV